jgi:hypothetical protein
MRFSGVDQDRLLRENRLYESFCRAEDLSGWEKVASPGREEIGAVYKYLRKKASFSVEELTMRLIAQGMGYFQVMVAPGYPA